MEKYYALIKNGMVESVTIADVDFVNHIQNKYDFIIDVSDRARPSVGDSYYSESDTFVSNSIEMPEIPVNTDLEHLNQGTENGFEPFKLSKYSVSYSNGIIQIGCKKYSGPGLLDVLHNLLIHKATTTSHFIALKNGPAHGKFDITWNDAQLLYDALKKVNFK